MKNKIRVGMCSAVLIGSLVGGLGTGGLVAYASSNDVNNKVAQQVGSYFKDVPTNHFAYEAIEWGKNKGLINGYTDAEGKPNGLFGPNNNVTEAQFVKMLSNYLGLEDTSGNLTKNENQGTHWSDTFYDTMAKYGVPLNGYLDNTIRNQPMKRGSVAQALAYLLGESTNLNQSINFLLENGITTGQNPQFEGNDLSKFFGSTNNLTRGQVITFLYRMDSKSLNNLSSIADMTASDNINLNAKAKEGYSYVDVSIGGSKNTNNGDSGNDNSNYDNFFGKGTTSPTGGNTSGVESKAEAQIINEMNTLLGSKNVELIKQYKMNPKNAKVNEDGTIQVTYKYKTKTEVYWITCYAKNGNLGEVSASYPMPVVKEIFANILGISKSNLTGTVKDTKIVHSKYKVYYSSDGIYALQVK